MNEQTKVKLNMLKNKVRAKSDTALILALCNITYKYRLFEEIKMELNK